MFDKKKILVTGGGGLLGTAMQKILPPSEYVLYPSRLALDLDSRSQVLGFFEQHKVDYVFHFAARVGGVKDNLDHPADFFTENLRMNTNILEACIKTDVKKLLSVLSTCVYPDQEHVTYPLTEKQLYAGPPHAENFGYAYAKRMMDVLCKAYRKQYDANFINVIPNNMFGEGDNFHYEDSHVIPALIRKIWEAKTNNRPKVEIWGTGKPLREFTYASDIAKICLMLMETYDGAEPFNIGVPKEYSIRYIAEKIQTNLEYNGKLCFNLNKPDGQFRKPSCNAKFLESTNWAVEQYTGFDEALNKTCKWFVETYPNVRGVTLT